MTLAKNIRLKIRIKKVPPVSLVLGFAHDGDVIQLLQKPLIKYKFIVALSFVLAFDIFVDDFCFYLN